MSKLRLIPYAVLTAGGLLAASGAANAQSMYDINQRQDYQQNRIEQGVRSGQITRSEEYRLEQGERAIDRAQRQAEADGRVSPQERARIDRMTDRQGREIYQQSHDRQQSWDRGQNWGRTDGRAHNGWNDRDGWGNRGGDREADRRDWGRDHNNGGWNQGRDHNGWNGANNGGWNHNPGNGGTGGTNTGWNHNGGWNHNPGTGTGGTGGTGGTNTGWNHNGGWNHGGTGTTTPPPGGSTGTTTASNRSWGGQTRPASFTNNTQTRSYTASNVGARSAGTRSFGGGHR